MAWLVFTVLLKVVKTTLKTALTIALIVILLQVIGIGPEALLRALGEVGSTVSRWFQQISGGG